MIWSAAKKKIEASATITNTMMVVIVVSRRVGQVTLAVSERTSCRNLNGLKAIVDVIRVRKDDSKVLRNPNSPLAPSPLLKDEPASGLDCSGGIQSRAGYPSKRADSRWRLCTAGTAKGQGAGNRFESAGIGWAKIKDLQNQGLNWQGRQGSNLRQPVLETDAGCPGECGLVARCPY